jgi:ankyrin repeat protein
MPLNISSASERGGVRSTSRRSFANWLRLSLPPQPRSVAVFAVFFFSLASNLWAGNSPLADAVESTDRAAIRRLLEAHADVNAPQSDGMTALHWAVYHDDLETIKLLLHAKADVKTENRYGVTPLSLACVNGNGVVVESLVAAGADVNSTLRGGETILMTAARAGKVGAVKALLAAGANLNAKDRKGQTAIMWAAADGHVAVVQMLVDTGADFRTPLDSGFTPFFFAVREGRIEVARALLKAGVDVNDVMQPKKVNGKSVRKGTSALVLAVENGHFDLALALLEAGADPNDQRSGYSALHVMTWVRKPVRGDGDDGDPPPIGSGKLSSLQFVRKLVEHGADVNAPLKSGRSGPGLFSKVGVTPFFLASSTADTAYMHLLVELGAKPLVNNADKCTPLMAATGIGIGGQAADETAGTEPEVIEAIQYLLELGADVNAVDANGETAMHGAAYKNLPKVVQLLTDKGAKVEAWNHKNKYGWTPLLIAQGYRPGNFKPSAETVVAIEKVMLAQGVTPPTSSASSAGNAAAYEGVETKKRAP